MDGEEEDKNKVLIQEEGGEGKVKRKMKTASQLELLEKTYAMETYPSEALRAELSEKLGLSDRQLQMWFCHRRLKDRKPPPVKRSRKETKMPAALGSSGGAGIGDELGGEVGNEIISGSGSGSSPFGHVDLQKRMAIPRVGVDVPAMKRYYEPPQAISELRAISFVEAQLGESLREDGPILGMEFDPLPPGAFGAPIVATGQQKTAGRPYEAKQYERHDAKLIKGTTRALHEYQFLPEQPSVRNDTYERAVSSQYYGSPTHGSSARSPLSTGRLFTHGSEQSSSGYGLQGPSPSLSLLPLQGKQGHIFPTTSGDYEAVPRNNSFPITGVDSHFVAQSIAGPESPFILSERLGTHDDEILRIERKRKSDEARISREVEAHEKRIRKELEKQDILRRKREEQMRREMERQDRERRKEEERLLREKIREEERYQREQRRELERREKFLQKESIRAEKLRLKEEMRKEKEAARLKAANERATARKIAKESVELADDEHVELMEIAASKKGLPSILCLDTESLQNLELFRDMLPKFPPKSVCLKGPFYIRPWTDSEENIGNLFMAWRFLITFADVLGVWPFTIDEFIQAFHDHDPRLLGEVHIALLRCIIKDIEDVARTPFSGVGNNQNTAANPGGGHPHIVEGAYAWGFDICSWQRHLNPLTWPEVLRQFAIAAGFGPKLKKKSVEQSYFCDENEGNDAENVISNLRNGAAAENALAIMQERGLSNPRRSRHRLTPGTVKFAAFHVLALEGSMGLTIQEIAEKIQKSGLRDLTTSKTPEASIAAALSRDSKIFERTAPSTYCVRAPYRKDPADAEVSLSAARDKIQVYKNGILDEEAEDVERDEVERDLGSESDVAEDLEVDDRGIASKPSRENQISCEANSFQPKVCSGNGKEVSRGDVMEPAQDLIANLGSFSTSMQSDNPKDTKAIGVSFDKSVDAAGIHEATIPEQEDTVIDEKHPGEPWVQELMEGEYSDMSVEERLNALVALIGVANEGNSIRIVLEDRLEAANVLKKQIWADAQVDRRRLKDDYVMKLPYSSFSGKQSPLFASDDKNDIKSSNPLVNYEHLGDPQSGQNHPNSMSAERALSTHEYSVGPDNVPFQQSGYAAEKSRSQLKAFIGHKAEDMYVYRSLPLGQDRRRNRYWRFITSSSRNDPGSGRIFVQLRDDHWRLIDSEKDFDALLASLDVRGVRESQLLPVLQSIEMSFRETVRKNTCTNSNGKADDTIKAEVLDTDHNHGAIVHSPSISVCVSNSDTPEPSLSFKIGLGINELEQKDALKRYRDFENWMWDECLNSSVLRAMKYGKTSRALFYVGDNQCPCHRTSDVCLANLNYSGHVTQCKQKLRRKTDCSSLNMESSCSLRIRVLQAQLSLIEASIPVEALQPVWSEEFRESWGMKLQTATSAEDLLQVFTLLEGGIKREFLSPDYETTSELLASFDSARSKSNSSPTPGVVSVLPWLPLTSSSVALRLMELDSAIYYLLSQKVDSHRDNGASDFMSVPSRLAVVKNISEGEVAEESHEDAYLQQESWFTPASGQMSSGQGRGRGRGRTRGGRSQKMVMGSRSEARSTKTDTGDGLDRLVGWKGGRTRGRGGHKRGRSSVGRRSARNRHQSVKKMKGIGDKRENSEDMIIDRRIPVNSIPKWELAETSQQVESPEKSSGSEFRSEDDDVQALGDEYEDVQLDNFAGAYDNDNNRQAEHFRQVDYGVDGDEDYDDRVEEEDDDVVEDIDVEGYFNGYSDEEGARDISGKQIGNADDITESSSEYSD